MYSIIVSLHYYELSTHPEETNQLSQYLHKYNLKAKNTINLKKIILPFV